MTSAVQATRAALLPVGLGLVAGYVDTVRFVALYGVFTAHVTGNFVLIGSELTHPSGNVLLKLLVFPAFIIAVALTRFIVLWLERRGRPALGPMLALQATLLAAFMVLGWAGAPVAGTNALLPMLAGMTGAAAMGAQNAVGRLLLPSVTPTTVMTGNVTQLVIDSVDLWRGANDPAIRARAVRVVMPVVAFALGAIGGAFVYAAAGFAALLVPMVVLVALAKA